MSTVPIYSSAVGSERAVIRSWSPFEPIVVPGFAGIFVDASGRVIPPPPPPVPLQPMMLRETSEELKATHVAESKAPEPEPKLVPGGGKAVKPEPKAPGVGPTPVDTTPKILKVSYAAVSKTAPIKPLAPGGGKRVEPKGVPVKAVPVKAAEPVLAPIELPKGPALYDESDSKFPEQITYKGAKLLKPSKVFETVRFRVNEARHNASLFKRTNKAVYEKKARELLDLATAEIETKLAKVRLNPQIDQAQNQSNKIALVLKELAH